MSQQPDAFEGFVEHADESVVTGWAWIPTRPDEPIEVELLVDGRVLARAQAGSYRVDLERAGKGNGRHAFEIALPNGLGRSQQLRVVAAGTGRDLTGSPHDLRVGALSAAPPAHVNHQPGYRSRFGGFWTDMPHAAAAVDGKRRLGWISRDEAALLEQWIEKGFVILRQAVPHELIDRFDRDVEHVWSGREGQKACVEFWDHGVLKIAPASPRFKSERVKLLDAYEHSEAGRAIAFAPPLLRFLTLVFERPALAFQSLYFRWGSRQDIHQDTAFVKVSSPLEFAASWVALEDIRPRSGELEYYEGSHLVEEHLFNGRDKWMPLPFDNSVYEQFIAALDTRCRSRGLVRQRFLPKKGDVLIWSADLAHGGSKDAIPGVTRKSLVTHYCPTNCEPIYGGPGAVRRQYSDVAFYTSPPR